MPACCRICCWVNFVISDAMLTSLMLLSDEDMFSCVVEIAVDGVLEAVLDRTQGRRERRDVVDRGADVAQGAGSGSGRTQCRRSEALVQVKPLHAQVDELSMFWKDSGERVAGVGADLEGHARRRCRPMPSSRLMPLNARSPAGGRSPA